MAKIKTNIPKGTRDFLPDEMLGRNYISSTIRNIFEKYGYLPVETPAMENLSTLLGKYGEEGDKLLYKILNNGNFLSKVDENLLRGGSSGKISELAGKMSNMIAEKGLRYDLTVPFARLVVQHQNEIQFPFKRYQIQPVWRADRPQKGRYREFYQCDADVIGSNSLLNEAELVQLMDDVFSAMNIRVTIKINNRKILFGIANISGCSDKFSEITTAIDKLDKTGIENVISELKQKGITDKAIQQIKPFLKIKYKSTEDLTPLSGELKNDEMALQGLEEINTIFELLNVVNLNNTVELDFTLARGLNYYTGAIFEVKARDVDIGSICGGGRYDDLTGIFGLSGISGVGISFGADRIYDVLKQLDGFPKEEKSSTKIIFLNFGKDEVRFCYPYLRKLRNNGVNAEIYPDEVKIKKQMTYANNRRIKFVGIVGEEEVKNNHITIKDMESGQQDKIDINNLLDYLNG